MSGPRLNMRKSFDLEKARALSNPAARPASRVRRCGRPWLCDGAADGRRDADRIRLHPATDHAQRARPTADRCAIVSRTWPSSGSRARRRSCRCRCSKAILVWDGDPNGTRTRVFAVKGRRPRPLDDGAAQEADCPLRKARPLVNLRHSSSRWQHRPKTSTAPPTRCDQRCTFGPLR